MYCQTITSNLLISSAIHSTCPFWGREAQAVIIRQRSEIGQSFPSSIVTYQFIRSHPFSGGQYRLVRPPTRAARTQYYHGCLHIDVSCVCEGVCQLREADCTYATVSRNRKAVHMLQIYEAYREHVCDIASLTTVVERILCKVAQLDLMTT